MKLLYVKGSPRAMKSTAGKVADSFLDAYRKKNPKAEIEVIDLWKDALPDFDGDKAAAKMTFFGEGAMDSQQKSAWDEVVSVIQQFASADDYLFTVPMWNMGIPYRLKHYIDILTQPGLLFGFDPATGYSGLLKGNVPRQFIPAGYINPVLVKPTGRIFILLISTVGWSPQE